MMLPDSALRIVWVYPDLLSTYGDQGNVLFLRHRAELRGLSVDTVHVRSNETIPRQGDLYLIGGGEDRAQRLAAERLRSDGGLVAAAFHGAVVLGVCAGFQLLGEQIADERGTYQGLGLMDLRSGRASRRTVGEVIAEPVSVLGLPTLYGFENHGGSTVLGSGARPLARVLVGTGSAAGNRFEGAWCGRMVGTYLHGPLLVRNPALTDMLLEWVAGPLEAVDEPWVRRMRRARLQRHAWLRRLRYRLSRTAGDAYAQTR